MVLPIEKEKKYKLFGITGTAMLIAQVTISMNYAHREFPYNFLAGVAIFFLGLLIGYIVYYFENRNQKDES